MKNITLMKVSRQVSHLVRITRGTPDHIKKTAKDGYGSDAHRKYIHVPWDEVTRALADLEANGRCAYMYGDNDTYILMYDLYEWPDVFILIESDGSSWTMTEDNSGQIMVRVLDKKHYQPLCDLVLGKVPVARLVDGSYAMLKETLDRSGLDGNDVP